MSLPVLFTNSELNLVAEQLEGDSTGLRSASIPVTCDPLAVVRAGARLVAHSTFFRTPDGDEVASLGIAAKLTAAGTDRFPTMEQHVASLPPLTDGARLMAGFSFSPDGPSSSEWAGFGAFDVVLPAVTVVRDGLETRLVVAVAPGADVGPMLDTLAGLSPWDPPPGPDPGAHTVESVPPAGAWQAEVAEAIGAIRDGSLEKVVLARSVLVHSERATDPYDLVYHLAEANPASYVYAAAVGSTAFVGASPELLLSQRDRDIRVNPLAGSARRGKGEDDVAVGEQLLNSHKNRAEHAIVVDDLIARLSPLTTDLVYPAGPSLRRMATVQHLSTEINGTLAPEVSTLDVLGAIHPTPAVGGTPRPESLAFIDKAEGIDRGWYAGGIGWLDPAGRAVVALSLRCALVHDRTSRLYAGNGIVAESDPATELDETRLKFQPLLSLLAAT